MTIEIGLDIDADKIAGLDLNADIDLNIDKEIENQKQPFAFDFDYESVANEVINFVIDKEGFPYEAEVNLLLTDDDGIQKINAQFRQMDCVTDVLSFPMIDYDAPGDFSRLEESEDYFNPDTGEAALGDIVLNVDRVRKQAACFGHSELREFAFLIVHSMLHLFGYDHMEQKDADIMEPLQEKILEELNILR